VGQFSISANTMGPKLAAAADFAEYGGFSGIGRLEDAVGILQGSAGTRIRGRLN